MIRVTLFSRSPAQFLLACCALAVGSLVTLRAAEPGFVFAEDFESGPLDQNVWAVRTASTATVLVQQTQVAHGKSALQVHYPKGGARSYAFIVASHLPESVRQHFFGRAYVFIGPNAPAGHDVLLNAGTPGYPISNFLELGASGGKNVMVSYQQNAADVPRGETIARGKEYPVGRWFCLEWEFNDDPDHILVWIDGEPAGELAGFTFKPRAAAAGRRAQGRAEGTKGETAKAPAAAPTPDSNVAPAAEPEVKAQPGVKLVKGFSDFAFGFRYWGSSKEDFDLYYDDIVIDTKRIGPLK